MKAEPGAYYLLTPPPGGVITVKQWIRKAREHFMADPGDISTNASQALINAEGRPSSYIADQLRPLIKNGMGLELHHIRYRPKRRWYPGTRPSGPPTWYWSPTATEFLAADGVRKIYEAMAKLKNETGLEKAMFRHPANLLR